MEDRTYEVTPSKEIEFDAEKFRELILHIADKSAEHPTFGATKLNKILYFSDFLAYQELGSPITGATYQHLEWGPAPRELLPQQRELLRSGDARIETRRHFQFPQKRLVAAREAKLDLFSSEELKIVDQVIHALLHLTAVDASTMSHEAAIGWQLTEDGEEIPYYTAYLTGEPPSDETVEWALELAADEWTARR